MYILVANIWKFIIQTFQLCVELNTIHLYSLMMLPKSQLLIRWLHIMRQYTTYLVLSYITNLIIYSNQHHMNLKRRTLVYLVSMIPVWLFILLELTEICAWEKHFLPQFLLLNSTLCYSIQNFTKYYNIFRMINLGGDLYYFENNFPFLWLRCLEDGNKSGMGGTFYYSRMKRYSKPKHLLVFITRDYYKYLARHL